jgi:hypothetical protein
MGQLVAAPVQLGVSDRFAALRHDDGRLVRADLGLKTWIHGAPPSLLFASARLYGFFLK